jgi:NadR type nicotinamide-nucleotide adenylyltransferase
VVKKIAITGPESTGKSNLAKQLAEHFQTVFVPEFARDYINNLSRPYNQEDILHIAENQLINERRTTLKANRFLFCDTELIVAKIWSLHKYNDCHPWILEQIKNNHYDLFLLCDIDIQWEFDDQREHPHLRQFFFDWYKKELEYYGFPYRIVSGEGDQRIQNAIHLINHFFLDRND